MQRSWICLFAHTGQGSRGKPLGLISAKLKGRRGLGVLWVCPGYVLCQHKPLSVRVGLGKAEHDGEGRVVALEFPGFYLVSVYVPNSGEGLKRLVSACRALLPRPAGPLACPVPWRSPGRQPGCHATPL